MAKIPSKANITNQLSKTTEELNSIKTILRSVTEATGDFNDILKEAQTALKNTSKYTEVLNAKLKVTTASELNIKDINNQLYKIKVNFQFYLTFNFILIFELIVMRKLTKIKGKKK